VKGSRNLTGAVSLVAALERGQEERRVNVDETWESNWVFLGHLLAFAFMSSFLLGAVLAMLTVGISSDLD